MHAQHSDHASPTPTRRRVPQRLKLALLAAALPPLVALLYLWLSTPAAESPAPAETATRSTQADLALTLADLATRAEQNPGNTRAWTALARAYRVVGRLAESAQAFARLGPALDRSPELLVEYADVLRALAGGRLEGRPLQLVRQALALDPQHAAALSLYATAGVQQRDHAPARL